MFGEVSGIPGLFKKVTWHRLTVNIPWGCIWIRFGNTFVWHSWRHIQEKRPFQFRFLSFLKQSTVDTWTSESCKCLVHNPKPGTDFQRGGFTVSTELRYSFVLPQLFYDTDKLKSFYYYSALIILGLKENRKEETGKYISRNKYWCCWRNIKRYIQFFTILFINLLKKSQVNRVSATRSTVCLYWRHTTLFQISLRQLQTKM